MSLVYVHIKMGRSRFPGKPLKFHNRKRISVLSGTVYHENTVDNHAGSRSSTTNDFSGEKEEEEKKESNNEKEANSESCGNKDSPLSEKEETAESSSDPSKSPVRTRSQNKMEPPQGDKPKQVKKTVTFGTVESCEDILLPLKKLPKHHAPLISIIKKKSAFRQSDQTFNSILKPAKLTDLSSKSSLEYHEGYLKKNLNPLSKSTNKFSQFSENRCMSPPPRINSPVEKESLGSVKFLPVKSSHSSRVIKPNKRFIDGEDQTSISSSLSSGKVLKKPKLKRLVFNNLHDDDSPQDEEPDKNENQPLSTGIFKDKSTNSFSGLTTSRKATHDLFSNEKESELLQDENSNIDDKKKSPEANKEERTGNSMRRLMDLSDASSSSHSSSGSESEDSWESESPRNSGDEEEKPLVSPEKDKSASQLLSGKVIIREARLQLTTTPPTSGLDGPFSAVAPTSSTNPPTTVTCGVCGAVRFYKFVKQARKFGIYSCESCRKFVSKLLKKDRMALRTSPLVLHCERGEGNCQVPPVLRSQQWKLFKCSNKARCPACWLKLCLKAFQVPTDKKAILMSMLPSYMKPGAKPNTLTPKPTSNSGLTTPSPLFSGLSANENESNIFAVKSKKADGLEEEDKMHNEKQDEKESNSNRKRRLAKIKVRKKDKSDSKLIEDPKRQKMELKGPRVKHVCRSASIVLGQPIATFPTQEEKDKDKPTLSDDTVSMAIEKDRATPEMSESEDTENKLQIVPEVTKVDHEVIEPKKRKVEPTVPKAKIESSEDETVLDLIPKKSTYKPLTNISNLRGRSQKCGQNRPELICVDFWESYDPDEVCNSGFGLIGTAPFTIAKLCFLCGSAGQEKMLVCSSCCEWYHGWCAEGSGGGASWTCARCVWCAACARPSARVSCRVCARPYHAACLPPAPPDHRSDWPQICSACLKCKSCDSSRVNKFVGSLPFCRPCFKLRQKGNYCPLCQACYRDNDFDSKMMECGWCARWVHASCEGLSGEGYQLLSALPPSIEYICCKCMPHDPPWRKMLTEHLKGRLLHLLKLLAKNKKACALLKLTPHKNTPVPNKPYRLTSPQAIRKLHFDTGDETMNNTTETKVYRNTAKGRRSTQKTDELALSQSWQCPLIHDDEMEKEEMPHPSHKVVNLQEPLMQNKEICFSTGLYNKTEFNASCVEVHENNPSDKQEKAVAMSPSLLDKYEPISDDDEIVDRFPQAHSEQDLSPKIIRHMNQDEDMEDMSRLISPSLLDIKKRVNSDEYISLKDFNHDMKEVIERTASVDLTSIYKELFSETFPWFNCDNNCLQPNLEVEGEQEDSDSLKDQEMSDNKGVRNTVQSIEKPLDQIVPKLEEKQKEEEDLLEFYPILDSRICILCKSTGDGLPAMEGRLLYCGQNDWIHANCALWSAEVFEEIDGSLQNVHSAISRGKMIKCASCETKGASVGCCAKNCSETYHYACARRTNCAFLDDKRVFCPTHGKDIPKKSLQKDADFELTRPVYVELDKKKKRYSEISKVQFLMGSLCVNSLGKIVPSVSDYEDFLMPVDFSCTRLFWSCKKPTKIVRYTIKTKLILAEPLPGFDYGVNITVDHTMQVQVVERVMAEIGAWHHSLEKGTTKVLMRKSDKSPIKFRNAVTLEDLAVKQVVDFLLDNVCKQEQQDEEEPQNTADLLPPEVKDAIFEDLNHDLLDGISMQDIFPKLMSYEDLVAMDLKSEFYGAMSQSDDKSDSRSTDFIDELLNARLESGSKELKRSKSEMLLQNHSLKSLTTGRGQQRSSSLTWNNKFDTNLLSSTIKRCKMGKSSTVTEKMSQVQRSLPENALDTIKESDKNTDKKTKREAVNSDELCSETPHTSGINYRTTSPKEKDESSDKNDKNEGYYTDVIDFYTKIQCSPISQLDGAGDWSGSDSNCSSRPGSPQSDFSPIQQLDGAEDHGDNIHKTQTNQYLYRASGSESTYTVTIAGNSISGQPELVMRPLDDNSGSGPMEQLVRCDRCQCTYRNKESYDRHIPSCDMMSTSESESENPKSPENRTLTTLQNAFQNAFAQPMIIHAGVVNGSENTVKAESISTRRTSINTRQITINGTIVETPSPGPNNEMTMTITEQMKSGTVIFDQSKTNVQVSSNQQVLSSPQIVVTPQMLLPPKTSSAGGRSLMGPQIITQPGLLPYNICVKPGNGNPNIQQIHSGADMTQLLTGSGGIQVISSNSNQVLTIPSNQMIQGKSQIANFPNMASASSIALPINSIQSMPNSSIIQNIQPMMRPQIQGNPTIVVPAMTTQRLSSPNSQVKQQIMLSGSQQKSPKKQSAPVQSKSMYQTANRARGRTIPKPANTIKRQTKLEKTITTINQSPLGPGNTVIQLQTNNQTGQPSIIVQPMANQNIMSYVEALSQQQNQNMQYIATIAPQGDYKTGATQFISQGSLMPQTFQIQQTESGGLVAVPSGGIPVLLPQGNVVLPQTLQQGATILPQGAIQTQGIISQGPNGPTILPQAIHTQNGTTIIPQGAIQGLTQGNLTSQATLLPNNTLQTTGATVVSQSGMGNGQTTIIPNALVSQGNTIISPGNGTTILPQGTILPQFCNDQVILGSAPTLEMVTDPSGCMYLTTQPVYYGLETIVQNTVMSSQQFVSTAMQGVLAQNSSFSATTTQVFQASKIEPIVEVPTGYVVVNSVGEGVAAQVASSGANVVTGQSVQSGPQIIKNVKTSVPNLTLQPLPDKHSLNRQTQKVLQMGPTQMTLGPQSMANLISGKHTMNPITSQVHNMTLANNVQNIQKAIISRQNNVSMSPNVTLVSSTGQPVMAISQSIPNSVSVPFSMQSIPLSQPIVSSSISSNKNNSMKIENSHVIEISGNLNDNSNCNSMPTISVTHSTKSPTPWRQINPPTSIHMGDNKIEVHNIGLKTNAATSMASNMNSGINGRQNMSHDNDKLNQNCLLSINGNTMTGSLHSHQFEGNAHNNHPSINTSNNMIQINSGNIYSPACSLSNNFDADTTLKLSKINALSKTEGGHMNFSQEIMAAHSQQHIQNEKAFQNMGNNDNNKHNTESMLGSMSIHKMSSCQVSNNMNNSTPSISIIPHNTIRPQTQTNQSSINIMNNQNQISSMSNGQMQIMNSNSSMQNVNTSCQEISNNRTNAPAANDNIQQNNQQHDINNPSMNNGNMPHGNMQIISHDNPQQIQPNNQIHILNGQIQHSRQGENNQLQHPQINQGSGNRSYHDNFMTNQSNQHSSNQHPSNMMTSRSSPENNNLMNQNINMHSMPNSHNINRADLNNINQIHMNQSLNNINNLQNNRMVMDNMQQHSLNNLNSINQMHANRTMETLHNQQMHSMQQQMSHHTVQNSNTRSQMDPNMHMNQPMSMQQTRQMENIHHHQHQMPNVMQISNNRTHMENNLIDMHQHVPNQMHNRQQIDNNMHMHHMAGNNPNMNLGNQIDNTPMSIHNIRHENNTINMQNHNSLNQIQNNRASLDHSNMMQHQMNTMNSVNNINMHGNLNSSMQMNNSSHQQINNSILHMPNIPDIKNEIQNACANTCSNGSLQFSTNQSFEMCPNMNSNNMNLNNSGNMMHNNMGMNNTNNMSNNMMMGNVTNNSIYGNNNQSNVSAHELLMSCNNSSDNVNLMSSNTNHMMMSSNAAHNNNNSNQMMGNQVPSNTQINISSCMNPNNTAQNQLSSLDSQINGSRNMAINESPKFPGDALRGKNIMGSINTNMTMSNLPENDCSKVNIGGGNEKQNHAMSVNNQMNYMQMNPSNNNRIINLPERNRMSNTNLESNMNQISQQHNIRVVTNNSNSNVSNVTPDPLSFQQKPEANSTMINVPFQAIPNSAPMNINVNSSNNTVNITVQNNLVDPKIASKTADLNFPLPTTTNLLQNQNSANSMICIPVQNNTINLPTQNSSSITLPKAPPTQQSGIPTNVVNPMSMRPMNRVLPLHRDGQSKCKSVGVKSTTVPKQRTVSHDMPDLNVKDENIDSDLEKAIEESKRMMELEKAKREKEQLDALRALQMSTETPQANTSMALVDPPPGRTNERVETITKMTSLPSLDAEIEHENSKVLIEKDINKSPTILAKSIPQKIMKRPLGDKKSDMEVTVSKKHNRVYKGQENKPLLPKPTPEPSKDDGPKLIYEVTSEDGFNYSSSSLSDLWSKVIEAVQNTRKECGLPLMQYNLPSTLSGAHLLGLNNNALRYLIEQLPGANRCTKYKIRQGRALNSWDNDLDLSEGFKESPWGSARTGPIARKQNHDIFSWMASPFREEPPPFGGQEGENSISRRLATLPPAMRFRQLKETSKASVGVYRSHIHGRGLFCKRDIEEGDMVIEYAGEVIRAVLADQREKKYEATSGRRGVGGCYMFRIDDNLVVDATLKGNAARFINHSCDPNCYSRVVDIHGHKHILIFALRRITVGEELTYDYKFPFEEVKIPCTCGAKKCRKYLN